MRTEFLCISVVRVASGPRVKLASCKSALNPPVVCSAGRSWGGGGGGGWSRCWSYSLLLCGLFYGAICCVSSRVSFCSYVF